jgi:catechol 2,3-dioxygenase-like lactoylglutathione lyase family enzyme
MKPAFDHLVVVAADVERTVAFYIQVLGAEARDLEAWRRGSAEYPVLHFGGWKINVHPVHGALHPRAAKPERGSVDLCVSVEARISDVIETLRQQSIPIELGPVAQDGALGWGQSVYFRDPDGNLLEIISYWHDGD